jgi:ribosome-associated heat shock protein Hsp15
MDKLRIDKWLWAARFYKTRSLATEEIGKGRVHVNDQEAKPAREVKVGDTVALRQGPLTRTLLVRGISGQRGPAPVAQQLYEETPESPAAAHDHGRPTKRDRRDIDKVNDKARGIAWNSRWSASAD